MLGMKTHTIRIMRPLLFAALWLISSAVLAQSTPIPQQSVMIDATVYQTTNIRQGPDTRFEILGRLAQDDSVQVFERESEASRWLHVMTETGTTGWIPSFSVQLESGRTLDELPIYDEAIPNPETQGEVIVVAYGRVNIRSGPGIQYEIVDTLDLDDEIVATARNNTFNDWLFVESETVEGWVAFFTVRVSGNPNTLPVLVPDSEGDALISPSLVLRARFNVRLHEEPTLESDTVVVVPFNSRVTLLARTEDADWLYIDYNGVAGWGAAGLFSTPPDAQLIPIYTPDLLLPEITPEATDEPNS